MYVIKQHNCVHKLHNINTINTLRIRVTEIRNLSFEILHYALKNKILFYRVRQKELPYLGS